MTKICIIAGKKNKKLLELKVVDISSNYICSGLKVGLQSRAVGEIYTFTKNTGR